MAKWNCCCCPLDSCPWDTATVTILGMTFSVEFPPPTLDCCQREVSTCEMDGPTIVRDCYFTINDWTLVESPDSFISKEGPFCDWTLPAPPYVAVDTCCNSSRYRVEARSRLRTRIWFWIQARVRFIVCYCLTPEGKPGYSIRVEMDYSRATILNTTRLIRYRNRKYTRICNEDYSTSCVSDPAEPAWRDVSGGDTPTAPPLRHGALKLSVCPIGLPANVPVFNPNLTVSCADPGTIPAESGPMKTEVTCEPVETTTCFGTFPFRMFNSWQFIGENPSTTQNTGTLIWSSGVSGLTPSCTEDTGEDELVVQASKTAESWTIVADCGDEYGASQGTYAVVVPQVVDVTLTRSCEA